MSESRKLIYTFDAGDATCEIYSEDEAISAFIIIDETVHYKDAEVLFQYSAATLGSLFSEMMESETLDIDLQGSKLLFSVKSPEQPITLLAKMGRTADPQPSSEEESQPQPRQQPRAEEDRKLVAANSEGREIVAGSSQEFKEAMKETSLAALGVLQSGGSCNISGKRRKRVFNENMQLQSVEPASLSLNYTPQKVLEALTEIAVQEKREENDMSLKGATAKFTISIREEKAKTQSQIDILKANNTAELQQMKCEAELRIESQRNSNRRLIADLKFFLEESERNRAREVDAEILNEKESVEARALDIEREKATTETGVMSEIAEHRKQVELLESQVEQQKRLLAQKTQSMHVSVQTELQNIEKMKAEITKRRAEEERLARKLAEEKRRERERLEAAARQRIAEANARRQADEYRRQQILENERRRAQQAAWEWKENQRRCREREEAARQAAIQQASYSPPPRSSGGPCSML